MNARQIIEKFGGQTALAGLVGKGQSTVAYWAKTGVIPARWQPQLLELARVGGINLEAHDFVDSSTIESNSRSEMRVRRILPADTPPTSATDGKTELKEESPFLFYVSNNGTVKVQVLVRDDTVWASQRGMSDIFDVDVGTVSEHLQNIFKTSELDELSVVRNFRTTAFDGKNYDTNFYTLDGIISVGYRVNSLQATQFRKWATTVLREYLIKGYALDDERLKQGKQLFGKDYFDDLLEKIREIRASERRFYQKITDIYAQCSIDYDKNSPTSHQFYAHVQDKLHYAIHGHTSSELIELRADSTRPHMGLNSWENEGKGGKVTKRDVTIGKNYLNKNEINELDRLVSMYLDFAESFARRQKPLTMKAWAEKLDGFLQFNEYAVLESYGTVKRENAERHAVFEYEKFRVIQDREYKSDFDKVVDEIKIRKRLPR